MRSARRSVTRKICLPSLMLLLTGLVTAPWARAQATADKTIEVDASTSTGYTYSNFRYHVLPANTPAGKRLLTSRSLGTAVPRSETDASLASVPWPGFYPDDLVYFGGPVVTDMLSHDVYLNAKGCGWVGKCWGNPERFLHDLGLSNFIHITDQYTRAYGHYGVGPNVYANMAMYTNTIDQNALFHLIHDAARTLGTSSGYGHEFHVFLPPGTDTCFDQSSVCYSPDNPSSFYFCAYHGSVKFSDIGHVLFSVEPYQNVPGCQAAPPNPNGQLADSTNSVLSHELIETITDPDISAWISDRSLLSSGAEIGDLCEPTGNSDGQFLDPVLTLNGHKYELQLEYSNYYHACSPK
jgi:hypothetical protein